MKIKEKIFDATTGETSIIERDETPQEQAEREAIELKIKQIKAEAEAKAAARQAILDRLGLTEDEARLLLGGN